MATLKVVKRDKPVVNNEPQPSIMVQNKVVEYNALREQKKTIEDRMKVLSEDIKEYAEQAGVKDANGSYYVKINDYMVGKQCKKSVSFNKEKAIEFFKKKKLVNAILVVESINEVEVEKYINEGKISVTDLEKITDTKINYAIDLKKIEEMPEVEQTNYKAASAKPPKSRK